MIYLVGVLAFLLLLIGGIALAEDLSKLNGYAVTFSVSSSSAQNVAKINGYAVVTGSLAATPGLGSGAFGSLALGIN